MAGLCFLAVNVILTIILTKNIKKEQAIDLYFLSALALTFLGNAYGLSWSLIPIMNVIISFINVELGISTMRYNNK